MNVNKCIETRGIPCYPSKKQRETKNTTVQASNLTQRRESIEDTKPFRRERKKTTSPVPAKD